MFRSIFVAVVAAVALALPTTGLAKYYGDGVPQSPSRYDVQSFITDTLAPGGKPAPVQGYRFITDTLAPGGGTASAPAPVSTSFDWADAGIGAGVTAGMVALLSALGIAARRRHRVAF